MWIGHKTGAKRLKQSCDDVHASTLFKLRFIFGTQVTCVVQTLTTHCHVDYTQISLPLTANGGLTKYSKSLFSV